MERRLLDEVSGFEFEDVTVDIFRRLGYEEVEKADVTADKGRDVIAVDDGTVIVAECKHTPKVGRPVVQKLHSAATTYPTDAPVRGAVVTSGEFTEPAREYAESVTDDPESVDVELVDVRDLRRMGERVGMNLYSGKIEVVCDETVPASLKEARRVVADAYTDVEGMEADDVSLSVSVAYVPFVVVEVNVDAVFETSVGVVHRTDTTERLVLRAERGGSRLASEEVARLVEDTDGRVPLDDAPDGDIGRFGATETEYEDWTEEEARERHATTVRYTGDNNVTYTKECVPSSSDVDARVVDTVYAPLYETVTVVGGYEHRFDFIASEGSVAVERDGLRACDHCDDEDALTLCPNCGAVACDDHTRTERLEDAPVCTDCAVVERFFLSKKYFYHEENLAEFREEYKNMPLYKKAMENKPLVAAFVVVAVVAGYFLL